MPLTYLVQHGEKQRGPGDPDLTEDGRRQAIRTGQWLRDAGLGALYSSPVLRAVRTAQLIATATGLDVQQDARLRERMNWDGGRPVQEFLADWAHSVRDRDFIPRNGDSSRHPGQRLQAFLADEADSAAPLAVVTHGGVTVDLLRTLLGDQAIPAHLMHEGIPSCAVTTLDGLKVIEVAATAHLS
jgi:broad specificity phosphatase PhoE